MRRLWVIVALLCLAAFSRGQELVFWITERDPGLDAALRRFEATHPGVKVVTSIYIGGKDAQKLMTAIVGGEPPDLVQQDRFSLGEWATRGAFAPLDPYLDDPKNPLKRDEFYPFTWAEATYEGKAYGVPASADGRALYYNEDMLRRAGYVDAAGNVVPPKTWDDLRAYSQKLTQRDSSGRITTLGFAVNYGDSWLYLYGWLNGGEFMTPDGRTVTLNDPKIVEALKYMRTLYDDLGGPAAVDAFIGNTTTSEVDPFALGRVAMKIDGDWSLTGLMQYHPDLRFGVAPPPAPAGRPSVTWSGGFAYSIPSTSKNPAITAELIKFLVSDEGWAIQHDVNNRYAASRGLNYIPRTTAQPRINQEQYEQFVKNSATVPQRVKLAVPVFNELFKTARFRPVSPMGQLLWDQHVEAINDVTRGGADAQATLDAATRKVQEPLDRVLNPQPGRPVPINAIVISSVLAITAIVVGSLVWTARRRTGVGAYDSAELKAAAFFVSPWAIGFVALTAGPILASLVYSFCRYDTLRPPEWIGIENFRRLAYVDPLFWKSLGNTAYMLIGVPLGLVIGLAIAMLLNAEVRGVPLYRTFFYLPSVVPIVASSILWIWVLNPTSGLINSFLMLLGVHDLPAWLSSPSNLLGSKAALILMALWTAGGGMVIWLAGLKGIPRHLYEAAEIDGAGPGRRFFTVTLPMLSPYIFFNLVMATIATMQIFTPAFIMTGGGPANSSLFYAYHLFNSAFRYFEMGYASALAWILLLIILTMTIVQMWTSRRWVQHDVV